MRFIKLAFISVIVIFIILSAMGALLPSQVLVSRAVDIHAPYTRIKAEVFQLPNWQRWMADAAGGKGGQYYDSTGGILQIGSTRIILQAATDSTLVTQWRSAGIMTGTFRLIDHHRADSLYTLQWQMEQNIRWYFWEKFAAITKDEIWGASMEKSLDNLKSLVENQ